MSLSRLIYRAVRSKLSFTTKEREGLYKRSICISTISNRFSRGLFSGSDPTPVNLNPYRLDRLYEDDRPQDRLVEEKLQAGTCKVPLLSQG